MDNKWFNLVFGLVLVAYGVYWFIRPTPDKNTLILLGFYFGITGILEIVKFYKKQ